MYPFSILLYSLSSLYLSLFLIFMLVKMQWIGFKVY